MFEGSRPIRPSHRKRRLLAGAVVMFLTGTAIVVVKQTIPTGLGGMRQIIPFLFFSEEAARFTSADGDIVLIVYVNDAGAAHSGQFPTWIVQRHWYGGTVVARGYLEHPRDRVPLTWLGPREFRIEFRKDRYDYRPAPRTIELN